MSNNQHGPRPSAWSSAVRGDNRGRGGDAAPRAAADAPPRLVAPPRAAAAAGNPSPRAWGNGPSAGNITWPTLGSPASGDNAWVRTPAAGSTSSGVPYVRVVESPTSGQKAPEVPLVPASSVRSSAWGRPGGNASQTDNESASASSSMQPTPVSAPAPTVGAYGDQNSAAMTMSQVATALGTVEKSDRQGQTSNFAKHEMNKTIELSFGGTAPPLRSRLQPGKLGKPVKLESNLFAVELPSGNVYHYDVDIRAHGQTHKEAAPPILRARCASTLVNRKVVEHLNNCRGFEKCRLAFDGRKNMYVRSELGFKERSFEVEAEVEGSSRKFTVKLRHVATISLDPIASMYAGRTSPDSFQDSIQALDVILRTGPTLNFVPVGRSFFSPPNREDHRRGGGAYLGGGCELWFGFYTSLRLGVWKPLVNVDMSATAFYVSGPLINLVSEILDPTKRLLTAPLNENKRAQLSRELRLLKVRRLNFENKRQHRIEGLSRKGANAESFEWEGQKITVAQYFARRYKIQLMYPNLPCAMIGKQGNMLPLECLELAPGQHCRKKLSDLQMSNMKKTIVAPSERFSRLKDSANELGRTSKQYCDEFQMRISPSLTQVDGRILEAATILYGDNRTVKVNNGVWKLDSCTFLRGARIDCWAVAVLGRVSHRKVDDAVAGLLQEGKRLGMVITKPGLIRNYGPSRTPADVLAEIKATLPNVALTMIILHRNSQYGLIKATAETSDLCMRTQCVKDENVERKFNVTFVQNLLQKINTKMGGRNNTIGGAAKPASFNQPFMAIGLDVNHPAPGDTTTPSVAALVASMDSSPSQYYAVTSVQRLRDNNRVEWVIDLKRMFSECLQEFQKRNGRLPVKLIIYRDGVSDGQIDAVRLIELAAFREACSELSSTFKPSMLFIVVQKRHHVRFRTVNPREAVGRSGNIAPGTVVDSKIVDPRFFDFYLCSHVGEQGTSRPSRYQVVHDDADHSPDEIYLMTYALCHTYSRCTRAVSIPAPAYYAHRVAFRAKEYIKDVVYEGGSDCGSSIVQQSGEQSLDCHEFVRAVSVVDKMKGQMYFV